MAAEQGGVFVDTRTIEQKMAWFKDLDKLPIGPTLPIFLPTRSKPIEPKEKKIVVPDLQTTNGKK